MEEKRHTETLRDQFEARVGQVEAEKQAQISEIDKLAQQIASQIDFLKVVQAELEAKKAELSSTSQACVQYLRREMASGQREHREKLQ